MPDSEIDAPLAALRGGKPPAPDWFIRALDQTPERGFVDVAGAKIETLIWGEIGQPGLLLLHGSGAHADWYSFIAPHLTAARAGLLVWAARQELPAWVWTVNEPRTVRLLLADPRVGAVITDRCAESAAAAAQLRARAPRAA